VAPNAKAWDPRRCQAHLSEVVESATAEVHRSTLVTRNVQHFEKLGVLLLNPWQDRQG
jgi:predicted nucleic acid-binding protein